MTIVKGCVHQRKCSGCPKIHLPADRQLAGKAATVLSHLKPYLRRAETGGYIGLRPVVKSPLPFGYRTSVKLCLGEEASGRRSVGLYKRDSKQVIDIPGCPVQHAAINDAIDKLFRVGKALPAPLYNHTRGFQEKRLKFLTLRFSPESGDLGLIVSHTGVERRALTQWLKVFDLERTCVFESVLTAADADLVIGPDCRHLAGRETIRFVVAGHEFRLPPTAFFQANFSLTDRFVEHVVKQPESGPVKAGGLLLDLYGGFGAYSLAAQASFAKLHVVDGNAAAIAAAAEAAARYGYGHLQASHAAVEDFLGNRLSPAEAGNVTQAIVNPPRSGLSGKARALLCAPKLKNLRQITYVSCNPETLGRDLEDLTRRGRFRLANVTPFDMFPQTEHVEVVAKLRR